MVRQLKCGRVQIAWERGGFWYPIAVNHEQANGAKPLVTQCPVTYRLGETEYTVPSHFGFDGASIPLVVQMVGVLFGLFRPVSWHLLSTLIHDYGCEYPERIPPAIADAIFLETLLALAQRRRSKAAGYKRWGQKLEAYAMYAAVRVHTLLSRRPRSKR